MSRNWRLTTIMTLASVLPGTSITHHTFAYTYNTSQVAEIVLRPGSKPRFSSQVLGQDDAKAAPVISP